MKRQRLAFIAVVVASFAVLGWTYDATRNAIAVDAAHAAAFAGNTQYYARLFSQGRAEFAIPASTLTAATKARQLTAFSFWTASAASATRPGDSVSYTSSWPHEPLVGNRPTGEAVVWTDASIILL